MFILINYILNIIYLKSYQISGNNIYIYKYIENMNISKGKIIRYSKYKGPP